MNRMGIVLAAAVCLAASAASAADSIKSRGDGKAIIGSVVRMTRSEVEIEIKPGDTKTVAVNDIESIHFDGEPSSLTTVRTRLAAGDFAEADKLLESAKPDTDRAEILADIEFYKALSAGRQALGGNGSIAAAGKSMYDFKAKNPNNYHCLEACELMGDLLLADGKYAAAKTFYEEVGKAPWEDYKMRANLGIGRTLLAQGQTAEAMKIFEDVLNDQEDGEQADAERRFGKLGKARCLTASGKTDEAVKLAQAVIDKSDPDDNLLYAEAYNTLGAALRAAAARETEMKAKDALRNRALLAYLHVDVLYNEAPNAHAEALANLTELFTELRMSNHAGTCRNTLLERYPASPWAKRVQNL